jgi:hypothetical protein
MVPVAPVGAHGLLVGVTGVHMDLGLVRRRGVTAVRVSAGGIVVPFAFGVTAGMLLPAESLALGAGMNARGSSRSSSRWSGCGSVC